MRGKEDIRIFLEEKSSLYNRIEFIQSDPVQVPHMFSRKEDIEIAAFLTATIAWGKRQSIISKAQQLMQLMQGRPYQFITTFDGEDLDPFLAFVHRTFNGFDCIYFLQSLRHIYIEKGGLEEIFMEGYLRNRRVFDGLSSFRNQFLSRVDPGSTKKHISDVTSGSAAKRLNMFLRWMVRKDKNGVDFGIWRGISPADLMVPLDVHSGSTARKLGLLQRKQNDWLAVEELTGRLREFDPDDPVRYDYALFGLGVFEKF